MHLSLNWPMCLDYRDVKPKLNTFLSASLSAEARLSVCVSVHVCLLIYVNIISPKVMNGF